MPLQESTRQHITSVAARWARDPQTAQTVRHYGPVVTVDRVPFHGEFGELLTDEIAANRQEVEQIIAAALGMM